MVLWKGCGRKPRLQKPTKAIRDGVKERYRRPLCEIVGDSSTLNPNQKKTCFINEPGLWSFLATSKQEEADQFQRWLFEVALPRWRQTIIKQGRHSFPREMSCLQSENDLHYRVIEFVRKLCTGILLCAGLGEHQDSKEKRIDSWRNGGC